MALGVDMRMGPWRDKVDITITPLDDRKFYLGMNFLDRVKAFIVPYASTLFITDDWQAHAIPMRQEAMKESMLLALRFSKDGEAGYLAASREIRGLRM